MTGAYTYPLLLKSLLRTALASAPDQEIVYRDVARLNYRVLSERIGHLAGALTRLGVQAGETIGVLDWDSHRYLESYFAVPGMGAVLHMVNIRLSPEQILYTINHAKDDALLVNVDFLPLLETIWDRLTRTPIVIAMSDDGIVPATRIPIAGRYEDLLAAETDAFEFRDFDENTRATTFYTTGTTGLPKGVFFSHRQLVLHTLSTATALGASIDQGRLHRGDVYMPITPMFHVHAWGLPFVATMLGLKQVYPGRYEPEMLLKLRANEGVSLSHCVPTLLHMLLTSSGTHDLDFVDWKIIIGGSALSKGLAYAALDRGIDVFVGYGMSETCPILTIARLTPKQVAEGGTEEVEARIRAGMPIPLVDLRIVDPDMNPLPADGRAFGEIVARAPWLTQGYYGDTAASEVLWQGGYLHTNDIGVINPDGSLQITDRMKDVIKTGGEWISSLEVEDLFSQHPAVNEVAVIGVPDTRWGERPIAIVAVRPTGTAVTEDALKAHLQTFADQGVISKWAIPTRIVFADVLEKTSVGKLNKKALRERYGHA